MKEDRERLAAQVQSLKAWVEWSLARDRIEGVPLVGLPSLGRTPGTANVGLNQRAVYVLAFLVSADDCAQCVRALFESYTQAFEGAAGHLPTVLVVTDSLGAVLYRSVFATIPHVHLIADPSLSSTLQLSEAPPTPTAALVEQGTGIVIWACPYQLGARTRTRFFRKVKRVLARFR